MADERLSHGMGERSNATPRSEGRGAIFLLVIPGRDEVANPESRSYSANLPREIPGSMLRIAPG